MAPHGKLELTWSNKDMRLLSHDDVSYEWIDPSDWQVAEVRLFDHVGDVGQPGNGNLLIEGDALHALTALTSLPEFAGRYVGKIKLCYIDPPFNTGATFQHYDDAVEHSVWLTMLRDRLMQVRDLLRPDGSVWVHLDDSEQHRARSVLDEVFGSQNFVASFVWQKVDSPNDNKVPVTTNHEFIHCYARDKRLLKLSPKPDPTILNAYGQTAADGHRYRDRLLKKNGKNSLRSDRPTMWFPIRDPDGNEVWPIHDDGREACWALGKKAVANLLASDEAIWKKRPLPTGLVGDGWVPYTREWAPDMPTRPWPTIWSDVDTTRQAKSHLRAMFPGQTVFATPKPEALMHRILTLATEPDDIVLDCFAGSGTTAAVAEKMGRRWVTVELSDDTLSRFTQPRLERVVDGKDPGGITELADWKGGGGFGVLRVGHSMFEDVDGTVVLAQWATNGALAEAVAAQLKYGFEPDGTFAGHRGRSRLAVLDGLLTRAVADHLIGRLEDKETVVVVAQALEPGVEEHVRASRPGSRARKVPRDLASAGQRPSRLVRLSGRRAVVTHE